jgi:hypothetical protein
VELDNQTPFVLDRFATFDRDGGEELVAVLKATYVLEAGAEPRIAEADEQDPIQPVDLYAGEPGLSGLLAEGELIPPKPATDVLLSAHAVAPRGHATSMRVGIQVGSRAQQAIVYGDRHVVQSLGVRRLSAPQPFARIPLIWENAFGGTDLSPKRPKHHAWHPQNPVGKGFFARHSRLASDGAPAPNIDDPSRPYGPRAGRLHAVGFRPVAPHWEPRRNFAGTYDEAWLQSQAPFAPFDFDAQFHCTAPGGLRGRDRLVGGETCLVFGTTPEGMLQFRLPVVEPRFRMVFPKMARRIEAQLDTVHVDTDRMRLQLIWRGALSAHGRVDSLIAIEATVDGLRVAA